MHLLRSFQERFGFTRNELTALIVLSAAFLAGSAIKLWAPPGIPLQGQRAFSYAAADSQFLALSRTLRDTTATERRTIRTQAGRLPAHGSINVNTASAEELQALPGIGPAIAGRIVTYRKEHGGFRTIDDMTEVKGIGPRILDRIRPFVVIRPAAQQTP